MVATPWGQSDLLRDRKLRPGPGTPREEVIRNQRERLFAAMVASVAERGYEATRVDDLVELSGVSSRTFYDQFADKRSCFKAAVEAMIQAAAAFTVKGSEERGPWEERARRGFEDFATMIVAQPAAARMLLVDAYAAGPEVMAILERAAGAFEQMTAAMLAQSPERAAMPREMIQAHIAAQQEIARTRLRRRTETELPALMKELWGMVLAYRPPPLPLRTVTRRAEARTELLDVHDHAERALRGFASVVAERGYAETTVVQVAKRASMSTATFYAHFDGKEDVLMAALESGGAQIVAACLPAARRAPDWPQSIKAGAGALLSYLASRPALARLMFVEVYAAGPEALERRSDALAPLEDLRSEGYRLSPATPSIAAEMIGGGLRGLIYRRIHDSGPETLPGLGPICTYITLAPFIGAEEACAVANWDGRSARRE